MMAKKAKAKRRVIMPMWIVRDTECPTYRAFVQVKPPITNWFGRWQTEKTPGWHCGLVLCTKDYEAGTPKKYHLKPGGGPLKMQLVRV